MQLQLVECPRDAMQGWPKPISTRDKIRYINSLLKVGFHTLDFGSFVSPRLMPQMADTAEVLNGLDTGTETGRLLAIVANKRGAEDAARFQSIHYLGFPFSVSETFQQRNTNSSREESLQRVADIQELCLREGKELVVYMSMGFGNPYGDPFDRDVLGKWMKEIHGLGIRILSLADTVGMANASMVEETVAGSIPLFNDAIVGVHLHATSADMVEKLDAAYSAGCRRFDGAIGGIGGCPMSGNELVGNMDMLTMVDFFENAGISTGLDTDALNHAAGIARQIFA